MTIAARIRAIHSLRTRRVIAVRRHRAVSGIDDRLRELIRLQLNYETRMERRGGR